MRLETFFEKFEVLAEMPGAVGKLREMICELAVRGKLVPQDQSDEPAVALLSNIRDEKAALALKQRGTGDAEAGDQDSSPPYSAPIGWIWTILGEVQVFTNGYAFKSEDYQSSGVGIIRMGELGANGEIDETGMKFVSNYLAQSLPANFRVKPGDLLMGMSGSIGKLAINRSRKTYLLNQRVGRLEPILIEKEFLHVFLKTVEQRYLDISFGMAIKNLSTKQINETPFPLPPLAEQKRIVAKVDELMALCDRLEAQQQEGETRHTALARASLAQFADAPTPANLDLIFHSSYAVRPSDLRKSILSLAVQGKIVPQDPNDEDASVLLDEIRSARIAAKKQQRFRSAEVNETGAAAAEPYELPSGWLWTVLGEVQVFTNGFAFKSEDYRESGMGIVRMGELGANGDIDESDMRYVPEHVAQSLPETFRVKPGDLLMGMSGSIGKLAINRSEKTYLLNQRVGRLEPIIIDKRYLQVFLRTVEQYYLEISFGMAIKNLSTKQINETAFPLPPLAEQHRIVANVEQLMSLVDALEKQLAAARTVEANLLTALVAELEYSPYVIG